MNKKLILLVLFASVLVSCKNEITYDVRDGYTLIHQSKGATLGYSSSPILMADGFAFKDFVG